MSEKTEVAELIKKRSSYKGQVTIFNGFLSSFESPSPPDERDYEELELRIKRFDALYNKFDEVQTRLECLQDDESQVFGEREEFENRYYKALSNAQKILSNYKKSHIPLPSDGEGSVIHSVKLNPVKLPTIQIPKFNGLFNEWIGFRDTFMSLIHTNNDLDDINKFHYLKSSLEGSAALVVSSVELSGKNYSVAWTLLCDRFDNKNLLIQHHVAALFKIETVTRETACNLKGIVDQLNKNLRALDTLGESTKHWDTLLVYLISQKLDTKSFREWEEYKGRLPTDTRIELLHLLDFLRVRITLLDSVEHNTNSKIKPSHKIMTLQTNNINIKEICPKCDGEHKLNMCSQFLALNNEERLQLLPTFKVCFNCFSKSHFSNNCKKSGCKICKKKHSVLVHVADKQKLLVRGEGIGSNTTPAISNPNNLTLSTSVSSAGQDNNCRRGNLVLLSTALVKLYDSNNREHVVRVVLDSGSTSSLLSYRMFQQLNLSYNKISQSVQGINNAITQIDKMCNLRFKSLDDSFTCNINCFILPSLTDSVPNSTVNILNLNIPTNICLADPHFYKPASIDLILGADVFWNIVGNQRIELGDNKPTLCETRLGWIVSGPVCDTVLFSTCPPNRIQCNFVSKNLIDDDINSTSNNLSLNSIQMVGPTVQDDLVSILLRFRQHKYVIVADVEKMYRKILVHPDDRYLQHILWRDNPSQSLRAFQLNTVTYGTASAPFLATRCLKQLGLECQDHQIAEVILHDFLVDDLLSGGDDLNVVRNIREKVITTLGSAGLFLRKWKSNEPQLISESATEASHNLNVGGNEPSKTLGLGWLPVCDDLYFPIGFSTAANTKRTLLSVISQIFDPLGLLSPVVIKFKIILQSLWLQSLSWDEPLPSHIQALWMDATKNLNVLNNLRVSRHVMINSYEQLEIHVFSDASERAYGACLYIRSSDRNGNVLVRLLTAKSRVAPIKPTTIPRLELCGAQVAAKLYKKVCSSLRIKVTNTFFWTDSSIVLGWLKMLPSKLNTFVRNRVGDILEITGDCEWRHVPTAQNPADYVSRGVKVDDIESLNIWWSGPNFLQKSYTDWPSILVQCEPLPEMRNEVCLLNIAHPIEFIQFERFSNFNRLRRAIAYLLRFIESCKGRRAVTNYLTETELSNSLNVIIRSAQRESFPEYDILLQKKELPVKSALLKFNVFLDQNNLMRIGGRISNSQFSYDKKHPLLLCPHID
ncbi:uncharacterized protein LOC125059771 [Pieris napi]|uniref:uncharacterized protein LOC125059771 n=1 Tax=Pieris napi TaxID=78633 RepID=UPI001FB86EA3|nr:uncharacterized protein LOC125059771 [Pieris napi]